MDPLKASMGVSGSALALQSLRMRVISENIANAEVAPIKPGDEPYQRKYVSFASMVDRSSNVTSVRLDKIGSFGDEFRLVSNPGHMAADENGMVKMPKVDMFMEMADMRETIRSYEANLQSMKRARAMISMAIDMMKG